MKVTIVGFINKWLIKHNFRKPKEQEEVKQRPPNIQEMVQMYNFHHNHATNILNLIMSTKMGSQYLFTFMTVQDQIIVMRDNLYKKTNGNAYKRRLWKRC